MKWYQRALSKVTIYGWACSELSLWFRFDENPSFLTEQPHTLVWILISFLAKWESNLETTHCCCLEILEWSMKVNKVEVRRIVGECAAVLSPKRLQSHSRCDHFFKRLGLFFFSWWWRQTVSRIVIWKKVKFQMTSLKITEIVLSCCCGQKVSHNVRCDLKKGKTHFCQVIRDIYNLGLCV